MKKVKNHKQNLLYYNYFRSKYLRFIRKEIKNNQAKIEKSK